MGRKENKKIIAKAEAKFGPKKIVADYTSYTKKAKLVEDIVLSPNAIVSKMSAPISDKPLIRQYSSDKEKAELIEHDKKMKAAIVQQNTAALKKGNPGSFYKAIKNAR